MNRLLTSTIGCLACVTLASVAEAQMVRVGPFGGVSVRAPFVSVDTLPFGGGTRVRAPFTSVNTRAFAYGYGYGYRPYGYGYYRPYGPVFYDPYPAPVYTPPRYPDVVYPVPSSQYPRTPAYRVTRPPNSMNDSVAASGALPDRLRASALQLKRSLSVRRDDGDVWIDYLAPDRIVETVDSGAAPGSLSDLLLNYEGVVGNASLSAIRAASGFNETHRLLRAFVSSPTLASPLKKSTSTPEATTTRENADGNSILSPPPVPEPELETEDPAPATPVRAADDGDNQKAEQEKEELPLPTPTPTPL